MTNKAPESRARALTPVPGSISGTVATAKRDVEAPRTSSNIPIIFLKLETSVY